MNPTSIARTIAIVLVGLTAACAGQPPSEAEFGKSVRHMTENQTYDLDRAYNPDPAPVLGGEVYRLKDLLEAYERNPADPTEDRGALADDGY